MQLLQSSLRALRNATCTCTRPVKRAGQLPHILKHEELCQTLCQCCSLCGDHHAKHCNTDALNYQYLKLNQKRAKSCAICHLHACESHHGHHGRGNGDEGNDQRSDPRLSEHPLLDDSSEDHSHGQAFPTAQRQPTSRHLEATSCNFPTLTCGILVFSVVTAPPSSSPPPPPPPTCHQPNHTPIVTNQLPPINLINCHQPIVSTNCHQPIVTHQLSPTNCHQSIATHQLLPTNCHQPFVIKKTATNQLSPTNCHHPIATYQLQTNQQLLPTNCHQLIVINKLLYQPIATNLGALQRVGCTPWRGWPPPLRHLRGRRSTWHTPGGRMSALARFGLRRCAAVICAAGAALGAFQGVGCTPWRGWVSALRRCDLRGRRSTWCTPGGQVYALARLGLRARLKGFGCTPWRDCAAAICVVSGGSCDLRGRHST